MSRPYPDRASPLLWQRLFSTFVITAMLLTTLFGAAPELQAAPAPSLLASTSSAPTAEATAALAIVEVAAPDINCIFDADCKITVNDLADHFLPPAASGDAFLQSRLFPVGEAGTAGVGLYPYLYRIDLRNAVGVTAASCVTTMEIDFGPIQSLDYNGDGKAEQIFVVTKGGLGNIKPTAAVQSGDTITFRFDPAICVGGRTGDSSFFFGLASSHSPAVVPAHLTGTLGLDTTLRAKAPKRPVGDIAYILKEDTATAAAFQRLLTAEGYAVDLIPLAALNSTNLKPYKLIIIANDTGYLESWGVDAEQFKQIFDVAIPVLGLGEGGYAFFGQPGGMAIGWGNGWHGEQQEIKPVAGLSYYTNPHDLSALLGGPIKLYNELNSEVAINLPKDNPNVTALGWEPSDGNHVSLVAEKLYENTLCYQLWGFSGGPRLMTAEGMKLFANAVRYGLNNCPPAQREPEVKLPERPVFNPKEQIRIETLQSDNTGFAAQVGLPEAQLWPVKATDGNEYMELALPGVDLDGNTPGLPGVPMIHRIIAIPEGATVVLSDVEVRTSKRMSDILLYPSQPEAVDAQLPQDIPGDEKPNPDDFKDKPFTIDEKAYASEENFPAQIVSVQPLGKMRDLNLVQVSIAAGQYNPAKRSLQLFDKVQLAIKFDGGKGGFLPREMMENPFDNQAKPIYELALNYEVIRKFPFPGGILNRICWGHEYLIITDPAFRAAADTLRTWKVQKGISTLVMETGNASGNAGSTKEEIQQTIRNKFNNCIIRPSYVLLLGDAEHIAPFYRSTSSGGANSGTDLDYALMDNADILPDLALGRIPVDTLDEANTVINKVVSYEKTPPFATNFYSKMSFAAYFQCCRNDVADDGRTVRSFIETAELVRDQVGSLGYNVERIYTTDTGYEGSYAAAGRDDTPRKYRNGAALPADLAPGSGFAWDGDSGDVIDAFNEGRFLVFHRDHGWSGGWGDPSFTTANIDSLTNGNKLPVVYSINCASGFFDNETSGGNANSVYWAEKLLRKSGGGAVGIIGDTRNSPTWANSAFSRGLFDATWPNVVPEGGATSIRRLGDIMNYGKSYLAGQVGVAQTAGSVSQTSANDDIVLYHVYGDPTMQMWTSNPWYIRLPRLYEIVKFDPTIWELRYPIEGAVITLLQEGNPVARATVRNGVATMPILLDSFNADKGFDLSAGVPGGMSTLLESSKTNGNVTPGQGGTLQDELGRIKLQFPAGAVDEETTIFMTDVDLDSSNGKRNQLRRFVLEGVDADGEVVDTFDAAYNMELHYTDEELAESGLDESSLQCSWLDESTGEWQLVESKVDTANNIVTCQIDHFTEFALRGEATLSEQPVMDNAIFLPVVVR